MRSLVLLFVASLAVLAPFASARAQQRGAPALEFKPITFETLEGRRQRVAAEEAFLTVPARRDSLDGRTMQLHVVRFRSTSPNPGPPIIYLAGGPGGSGSRSAAGDRFDWFQALRAVGDVIAFDQRGTFGSKPYAVCPGAWSYPLDIPLQRDSLTAVIRRFSVGCVQHWTAQGVDFRDFNTEDNADDVEALRAALGVPQVSLIGISYGTHLALSVLRRHPRSVYRAVLAGVEGPDQSFKLPSNLDHSLLRVDSLIRADRAMNGVPSLAVTLRETVARLTERPATVRVPGRDVSVTLGPLDVQLSLAESLGDREDMEALPVAAIAVARGDLSMVAAAAFARRTARRELVMAIATDCASGATEARLARIAEEAPRSLLSDVINLPFPDQCSVWPHRRLSDAFRAPVVSDVPTLFVSGSLDGRTPPSNAEETARTFTNQRQLVIENGAHDDDLLIAVPAIGLAMREFLSGREPASLRVVLPPLRFRRR